MAKPKSRITVTNKPDGVMIRATGTYALKLLAALAGKTPADTLCDLQEPSASPPPSPAVPVVDEKVGG